MDSKHNVDIRFYFSLKQKSFEHDIMYESYV